jgi:hypothetical protein
MSQKIQNQKCIVCGKNKKTGILCYSCYKEKEKIKTDLETGQNQSQIKAHYYNLKNNLYKMEKTDFISNGLLRLIAISEQLKIIYNNDDLNNRLISDIEKIKKNKLKETEENNNEVINKFDDVDYRKQWPAEHQCDDGHYVRSLSEKTIDNWLYSNGYLHAYEKSVFMPSDPEDIVISDFYLPQGDVYIEFWGLEDDEKYLERKKRKLLLYEKNKLNLISLNWEEIKRINDILPRRLHSFFNR